MNFPDVGDGNNGLASKDFIRLKDKESVLGVFRGNPHNFRLHWKDKKSSQCKGKENGCLLCQDKDPKVSKAGFRFRLNFITRENNEFVAKIFEQSWGVYQDLKTLNTDYPLDKYVVKITRNGMDNSTRYNIMPQPNGLIKPELEAQIAKIQLKDLVNLSESQENGASQSNSSQFKEDEWMPPLDEDMPF
jgi:hypothetical protein